MMMPGKIPIARLREINELRQALDNEEAGIAYPRINDFNLIPKIYRWYKDNVQETDTTMFRKKFIFLVLCLFSMRTLLGARMPRGMRAKLKQIFPDLASGCSISNYARSLVVEYLYYPDFRDDADRLFVLATEELAKHNRPLFADQENKS